MAPVPVTREAAAAGRLMRAIIAAAPVCVEFEHDPASCGEYVEEVLAAAAGLVEAVDVGADRDLPRGATREDLGRVAFDAYNTSRGGKTWDGKPTPAWEALGDGIREAWCVAAEAARGAR